MSINALFTLRFSLFFATQVPHTTMMISIGMVGGGEGKEEQREKEGGEGKEVRKTGIGIGAWGGKK